MNTIPKVVIFPFSVLSSCSLILLLQTTQSFDLCGSEPFPPLNWESNKILHEAATLSCQSTGDLLGDALKCLLSVLAKIAKILCDLTLREPQQLSYLSQPTIVKK